MSVLLGYVVTYRLTGRRPQRKLDVQTVGKLTKAQAVRLVSQHDDVPKNMVEIIKIKEA